MNPPAAPWPPPYPPEDEIDLWELWDILWSEKFWIMGIALAFGAVGAVASLLATPVFESRVVLAPVQQNNASRANALLGQFGGLVGLAGVSASPQVPVATLRSVQFAEDFIERHGLMPILFEDEWDADTGDWKSELSPEQKPDIRDGVKRFVNDVMTIAEDTKTGLVTITVGWSDPLLATEWANQLAEDANMVLRDRALAEAERNVAYLQSELPTATSVTVQQSMGRLLDQELQTVMLAKGNAEYAFKVIDPAKVPKLRSSPKRTQQTLLALIAGGFIGVLFVFFRRAIKARRERIRD